MKNANLNGRGDNRMCVVGQIDHTPSEVIPHYNVMFILSLGFTSGQPSLVGYTDTPPPLSHT